VRTAPTKFKTSQDPGRVLVGSSLALTLACSSESLIFGLPLDMVKALRSRLEGNAVIWSRANVTPQPFCYGESVALQVPPSLGAEPLSAGNLPQHQVKIQTAKPGRQSVDSGIFDKLRYFLSFLQTKSLDRVLNLQVSVSGRSKCIGSRWKTRLARQGPKACHLKTSASTAAVAARFELPPVVAAHEQIFCTCLRHTTLFRVKPPSICLSCNAHASGAASYRHCRLNLRRCCPTTNCVN
jgi:hypothetical protein